MKIRQGLFVFCFLSSIASFTLSRAVDFNFYVLLGLGIFFLLLSFVFFLLTLDGMPTGHDTHC